MLELADLPLLLPLCCGLLTSLLSHYITSLSKLNQSSAISHLRDRECMSGFIDESINPISKGQSEDSERTEGSDVQSVVFVKEGLELWVCAVLGVVGAGTAWVVLQKGMCLEI